MKLAITGATGSIGSAMESHCLGLGWDVIQFDPRKGGWTGGMVDALILCHGGEDGGAMGVFEKNALATRNVLSEAFRIVRADGIVIVLASRRAIVPSMSEWDYSAAKAAQRAYVKAFYDAHPELRVTIVSPGWVESRMAADAGVKNAISVQQLCRLMVLMAELDTMRIPEVAIEPIGDAEL